MSQRSWVVMAALWLGHATVLGWVVLGASAADKPGQPEAKGTASADVFGLTRVHEYHLQVSAREWERMQPTGGGRFPGGPFGGAPGGPAKPVAKPGEEPIEVHKGGGFGVEFPWAHADFTAEGKTYKNVGLRYKGNASYMASARGLRRNLKVDLDHYDDAQRYQGLKALNLNAGAMDATRAREALSYAVFRAAGVPAPRTAFARITLTVPGKYDRELLGLYTVVEQVDRAFLKDRFGNGKGLLMKPERVRAVEYLGDDWERYKAQYQPKHDASKKEARRVIDFARLIHRADDEQFRKEIASYLDVEEFLRFVAVNALLMNLDSMFMMGHNYYIYLNPETDKFVFIPWDLDLSLAGFPMAGGPDQQVNLSLGHPYVGENRLIERLLAVKEINDRYQKVLKELSATCFAKERLLKDLDDVEKVTNGLLAQEKKAAEARKEGAGGFGFGPPGGMFGGAMPLKAILEKRTESVVAQVDGKSKGIVPALGFGPPGGGPGGFGGPPQPGQILPPPLQDALRLTAEQRKQLEELQKDVDTRLAKLLTEDQKKQLKAMREGFGRGGFGPGGFGPGVPPGGFGPGNFLARPLLEALDSDRDGKVSKDEWVAGVRKFFEDTDKDKKGRLDEKQIAEGLNRLFPRPPGFGPGGPGGPGGFGPGAPLAAAIVKRANADRDGRVTLDGLVAAAEALFKEVDKDKKGKLDEAALAAGIGQLFPPPPGFGPPGGPPQ